MENCYTREFRNDEWELLREKRLEALKENASLFAKSFAEEAACSKEHWTGLIGLENGKVFGLWHDTKLIGITGVFRNRYDESGKSAMLVMSYIERGYRGRGLSRLLYEARIEWARAYGYERILVSHRDGNEASRRANAAFGFKLTGSEEVAFGDGTRALDHRYEIQLK